MTEQERYINEINEALKDSSNLNAIKICDTPLLLQNIGLENKPILYSRAHLSNAVASFNRKKHQHGISIDDIYNLPNYINNPAIILKNYKDMNKPILIFDTTNSIQAPLFAILDSKGKAFYEYKELDSNFILTIHGKEDFVRYLNQAYKNNEIIFYDKKRVQRLETLTALSLCNCISNLEPNKILQHFNENVNSKESKSMNKEYEKLNLEEAINAIKDGNLEFISSDFTFRNVSKAFREINYMLSLKGVDILMFQMFIHLFWIKKQTMIYIL